MLQRCSARSWKVLLISLGVGLSGVVSPIRAHAQQSPFVLDPSRGLPATQAVCPPPAFPDYDRKGNLRCVVESVKHRTNWGLFGGGLGMWLGSYLLVRPIFSALIFSDVFSPSRSGGDRTLFVIGMFIPIVGPFLQMGGIPPEEGEVWHYLLLGLNGALEVGGLVMFILGLIGEDVVVKEPISKNGPRVLPWHAQGPGLSLSWAF
ncbi:MAG: hypothetical protein RMJ84_04205 [Sandaracinaceae bacterium]|nr:hypothetical protein [Sandaracinaceae bacterium]